MSILIKVNVNSQDKIISIQKKRSGSSVITICVKDIDEDCKNKEEEINFRDEEQVKKGRAKIYERIVNAQKKVEEAKKTLQLLTQECFIAEEELESYNFKALEGRVRSLSEQHLICSPNFNPLLYPKAISELIFYSDSDSEEDLEPALNVPPNSPAEKIFIPTEQNDFQEKKVVGTAEVEVQKEAVTISSDDDSYASSDSSSSSSFTKSFSNLSLQQKKSRTHIKRKPLGEVLEIGDKMVYKKDENLIGIWNGTTLVYNEEEFSSLSKLNKAHQVSLRGQNKGQNYWKYYFIHRNNGEIEHSLDLFIIK